MAVPARSRKCRARAKEESKPTIGGGEVLRRLAILVWRELDQNLRLRIVAVAGVAKHPRIFVFDEATSALDTGTERAIQKNLERVSRGTTTLIIAHRLSTVVHADEIVVLREGRVAERGRHEALLARGGVYAEMWQRQQEERAHA